MKPAPMLVAPFQVKIGRGPEAFPPFQHGGVGNPRIEPDIEDVHLLAKLVAAALRADRAGRQQRFGLTIEPAVRAFLFEKCHHMPEHFRGGKQPAAVRAGEDRDRDAPGTLPGNAPVRAILDHAVDPLLAPTGNPFNPLDPVKRLLPQAVLVHGDEPLFGGAEDDRLFAPPAMRVAVLDIRLSHEAPHFAEFAVDRLVGIEHELPRKIRYFFGEAAVVINRGIDLEAIFERHLIVFAAMPRGGVDAAGTGFEGHMAAQDQNTLTLQEGMVTGKAAQVGGPELPQHLVLVDPKEGHAAFHQAFRQNPDFTGRGDRHVIEIRMQGDGQVGRNGPGGGGPDEDIRRLVAKFREERPALGGQRKFDIDRG